MLLSRLYEKVLATDRRGRLLVVDRTEYRIVVYDSTGHEVRTYGKRGPGPGELLGPLWVDVRHDERVLVGDAEKNAVVAYAADGTAEPEFRLTPRRSRCSRWLYRSRRARGPSVGSVTIRRARSSHRPHVGRARRSHRRLHRRL